MNKRLVAAVLAGGTGIMSTAGIPAQAASSYTIVGAAPLNSPQEIAFAASGCNPALANLPVTEGSAILDVGAWSGRNLTIQVEGVATAGIGGLSVSFIQNGCVPGAIGPTTSAPGAWTFFVPGNTKYAVIRSTTWPYAKLTF